MTAHPIDTEALRRLADQATPGPWHPHPAGKYVWTEELGGIIQNWSDDANAVADMEFIAAARETVPALLDRIARLEAQSDIRGRAVVIYRERAREAEAERDCRRRENAELRDELVATQEYGAKLAHGKDEAEARIKAVQALHTGTRWPSAICDACDQPRPCPTIRALDGDT